MKTLHSRMLQVANSYSLPESFRTDLDTDLAVLEAYAGKKFVWLLRTCGSTLVPIHIGVDPVHITSWLAKGHGQVVIPFLLDTQQRTIEKISDQTAEKLIQQPPLQLNTFLTRDALRDSVSRILQEGRDRRIWGVFQSPSFDENDWGAWLRYFSAARNVVMHSFMLHAIRLARFHSEKSRVA